MGPETNDQEVRCYVGAVTGDGRTMVSLEPGGIRSIPSLVDEWDQLPPFPWVHETSVKLHWRPSLPKTRRRFVKFLMSKKGMDRNTANRIADVVGWWQGRLSYAEMTWRLLTAPLRSIKRPVFLGVDLSLDAWKEGDQDGG